MNIQQQAMAFTRAYMLFEQIYERGVTVDNREILSALPGFPVIDTDNLDRLAAQHYQVFGQNVFPYASVFLSEDGLPGGTITDEATRFYQDCGYVPDITDTADHVAIAMGLLCWLCGAEHDAHEDNADFHVSRLRALQQRFLDDYLLRWLPVFVFAVHNQNVEFYASLAQQSLDLILVHRAGLDNVLPLNQSVFALPEVPDLISQEKTSLRDISGYLLTPAHTGFFISKDEIRIIAKKHHLPHGFGSRQQILTNLLRTAAAYEQIDAVFAEFAEIVLRWQSFYTELELLPDMIKSVWLNQLDETETIIRALRKMAATQRLS
ncbi:MAG: TorD/DmsD family molecular chaperone, partial [Aggregatilineales bacterium]